MRISLSILILIVLSSSTYDIDLNAIESKVIKHHFSEVNHKFKKKLYFNGRTETVLSNFELLTKDDLNNVFKLIDFKDSIELRKLLLNDSILALDNKYLSKKTNHIFTPEQCTLNFADYKYPRIFVQSANEFGNHSLTIVEYCEYYTNRTFYYYLFNKKHNKITLIKTKEVYVF